VKTRSTARRPATKYSHMITRAPRTRIAPARQRESFCLAFPVNAHSSGPIVGSAIFTASSMPRYAVYAPLYERKRLVSLQIEFTSTMAFSHGGIIQAVFDQDSSTPNPIETALDPVSTYFTNYRRRDDKCFSGPLNDVTPIILRPRLDAAILMPNEVWTNASPPALNEGFGINDVTSALTIITSGVEGFSTLTRVGYIHVTMVIEFSYKRAQVSSFATTEQSQNYVPAAPSLTPLEVATRALAAGSEEQ